MVEIIWVAIVLGLGSVGLKVGRHLTLLTLLIFSVVWGVFFASIPNETLVWLISFTIWVVPSGSFLLCAWIDHLAHLKGSEKVVDKLFSLFLKDVE